MPETDSNGIEIRVKDKKVAAIIPVSDDYRESRKVVPDVELICLWCGKFYNPYDTLLAKGSAHSDHCSMKCFLKDMKWGRYKEAYHTVTRWIYWKWHFKLKDWLYRKDCPVCGKRMNVILAGRSYICDSDDDACWEYYSVNKKGELEEGV